MARKTLPSVLELGVAQAQMNYGLLQDAVVALAISMARSRVTAAAPGALTDSSGGVAAATAVAITTPAAGTVDAVTLFAPKAGFDTAVTAFEAAHAELAAKLNVVFTDLVGDGTDPFVSLHYTPSEAGTDGTIAAITATLTGDAVAVLDDATGYAEILKIRNVQASIMSAINYASVALGIATVADNTGGETMRITRGWDLNDYVSAATGASPATGEGTLTLASVNAALEAAKANVATMAAAINALVAPATEATFVVATTNPRTRLVPASAE